MSDLKRQRNGLNSDITRETSLNRERMARGHSWCWLNEKHGIHFSGILMNGVHRASTEPSRNCYEVFPSRASPSTTIFHSKSMRNCPNSLKRPCSSVIRSHRMRREPLKTGTRQYEDM